MKCAVAVVLALIGMAVAHPAPSLGHLAIASPLLLPSAVSVESRVINHGHKYLVAAPVILHAPLLHTSVVAPLHPTSWHGSYGWGKGWL